MASKMLPNYYHSYVAFLCLIMCLLWLQIPIIRADDDQYERNSYIVYMGDRIPNVSVESFYIDMLSGVLESVPPQNTSDYLLYTYESFQGCVAKLTPKEADIISKMNGVISVFPNRKNSIRTTRSWDFMGFPLNIERSTLESNVIIGVIDTGVWPESESFKDDGFGPPPSKWKGVCQTSNDKDFTCNNKLIGARYFGEEEGVFEDEIASPRDINGHGTHTASTAAGGVVNMANFLGFGLGTARGGVPSARIAMYKVCWGIGFCFDADILAAIDTAICDGVDVLSISLGGEARPYFEDPIAIGAFYAMRKGILTSTAAGNSGPGLNTVENFAPWLLSVGASTIDRTFTTKVQLGNGMVVEGISVNTFDLQDKTFPLIYAGDAQNTSSEFSSLARYCLPETLNRTLVKDKIVLCDFSTDGEEPFHAGAAGMIMHITDPLESPSTFPLAASQIHVDDAARVLSYARSLISTPFGTIHKSMQVKDTSAPFVGSFSSRGPHPFSPEILKPDITAPGVNILAAWSPVASVSGITGDKRSVLYNMLSGTSMACPHAAAAAAYVKSFHPTWSEAAIKSALMTTALPMSSTKNEEAEFAYGSGHINPAKAKTPGLVYDAEEDDYVKFLCSQGFNQTVLRLVTRNNSTCMEDYTNWDLNYPSIAIPASSGAFDVMVTRTVTNVGSPNSTYNAIVNVPEGLALAIEVQPSVLAFKSVGQKLSFTVRISGSIGMRGLMSGSLVWDDCQHQVRSPIVVYNLS